MRAPPLTRLTLFLSGVLLAILIAWGATTAAPALPSLRAAPVRPGPLLLPPAGLCFVDPPRTLGEFLPGEVRPVDLAWRRTGAGPLEVLAVRAGCGCLSVGELPRRLGAGACGSLKATLRAPDRPGPFAAGLSVVTDAARRGGAPEAGLLTLRLGGWVACPLGARPRAVALGPRHPGSRARVEVQLQAAAGGGPGPWEARLEGLPGTVALAGSEGRAPGPCTAGLTLQVPQRPGPFTATLAVTRGPWTLGVPIRGEVVAPEDAAPAR